MDSSERAALQQHQREHYPWDTWLDGAEHVVRRGPDFSCPIRVGLIILRRMAAERGGTVDASITGDTGTFRFIANPGSEQQ